MQIYERLGQPSVPDKLPFKQFVLSKGGLVDFDHKQLKFGKLERKPFGGFHVPVYYGEGKQPLAFQTPPMKIPFGLNSFKSGSQKSIELSFEDRYKYEMVEFFFRVMRVVDFQLLKAIIKNRKEWLPGVKDTVYPDDELWKIYSAITRIRHNKEMQPSEPRLTVKIYDNAEIFPVINSGDSVMEATIPITKDNLPPRAWLVSAPVCTGLWIDNGKGSVAVGFKLDQARLMDEPTYKFDDGTTRSHEVFMKFDFPPKH